MTHEPECEIAMSGVNVLDCICGYIAHAYRRGREDAAHAACDHIYGPQIRTDNLTYVRVNDLNGLFAAARGVSHNEKQPYSGNAHGGEQA